MTDEPEIEPQCILCGEGEHRCDCQDCQCEDKADAWVGMWCTECGGIVR